MSLKQNTKNHTIPPGPYYGKISQGIGDMAKENIKILTATDLRYLLIDSLNAYTDFSLFIEGNNPYKFEVNKHDVYIYIKNTHSSGAGRTNPDECRIQIGRSDKFRTILDNPKKRAFFLGYSDDYRVFTAWDPAFLRDRINQKDMVSLYSRFSVQKEAQENGIAIYSNKQNQKAISFAPEYIGLYIENYEKMHQSSDEMLRGLIKQSEDVDSTGKEGEKVTVDSEEFQLTKTRVSRNPAFKKLVNFAYENRCAMSGIQLDIVEAAHIVPHSHEKGSDDVRNGICLSPLHHRAYDAGLIYFDEEYNLKLNEEKVSYLEKIGKDGGLKKFSDLLYEQIRLPKIESYYPTKENIRLANQIRGIISPEVA